MSVLEVEQIKFFHSLKLQPVSKKEKQKWAEKIERYLISEYNINDCFVKIENFVLSMPSSSLSPRKIYNLRERKTKRC